MKWKVHSREYLEHVLQQVHFSTWCDFIYMEDG